MTAPETPAGPLLIALLARLDALPAQDPSETAQAPRTVPLAVLDTNAVLDVWYWHDAKAADLACALEAGEITWVSSPSCIKELAAVLARPAFGLGEDGAEALLEKLISRVVLVSPRQEHLVRCRDRDDEKFLTLAFEVRADFLFTKDKKVLKAGRRLKAAGTKTMRPEDFVRAHAS